MPFSVEQILRSSGAATAVLALLLSGCFREPTGSDPPLEPSLDVQFRDSLQRYGAPLPIAAVPAQNQHQVALGRALFFDKILSGNRDISCGTCHEPENHGTDRMSLAVGTGSLGTGATRLPGHGRQFVPRNAPSMLNAALIFPYFFWDGRLADFPFRQLDTASGVRFPGGLNGALAKQAMLPVLNRIEMRGERGDRDRFGNLNELAAYSDSAATEIWSALMRRLLSIDEYLAMFATAYPGTPTQVLGFEHAANAIAAFELEAFTRTNSPFDRFLVRDSRAMSEEAKRGGLLFFGKARCVQCHNGPLLGGSSFANIGIPQFGPGFGKASPLDIGHGEVVVNIPFYRFAFRVQALRNVELTAPYMHNGAYPTLEAVVQHYTNADSALRAYDVSQLAPSLRGSHRSDAATIADIARGLDGRVRQPISLSDSEQRSLVAFLKSLTDPAARTLSGIAPSQVPSGLPVRD